jgi:hypothetical protein
MLLLLQSLNSKSIITLTLNNLILLPYKWSYDKTTEILKKTKQKNTHTQTDKRFFSTQENNEYAGFNIQ